MSGAKQMGLIHKLRLNSVAAGYHRIGSAKERFYYSTNVICQLVHTSILPTMGVNPPMIDKFDAKNCDLTKR